MVVVVVFLLAGQLEQKKKEKRDRYVEHRGEKTT